MSVNITVNGKFAKHCRTHSLLDDPEKVKKAEEQERRKLRLLQVREESKKLAKKIREEVNEEKRRELQKLQAIKEQELECWRQHALDRKGEEYRSAIFQMGTAHNAARLENAQKAERQKQQNTYKNFRKQVEARKINQGRVQFGQRQCCPCHQNPPQCVNKQFECNCVQTNNPCQSKAKEHNKRKRRSSLSSSDTECEAEGYNEQTTLQQSCYSLSSASDTTTSLTLSEHNKATQTSTIVSANAPCLNKTPAICVDVEVDTEDSVVISAPIEVKDKHSKYNRQFCSVIRVSPSKGRKHQSESTNENPSIQQSTTATQSSDVTTLPTEEPQPKSPTKQATAFKSTTAAKEKHFTLISDIVKKQQKQQQQHQAVNIPKNVQTKIIPPAYPPVSLPTSTTATPHVSPRKQINKTNGRPAVARSVSPRKTSAPSRASKTITDSSQPTAATVTLNTNTATQTAATSASISSGKVQFFDYKSKIFQERDQAAANVRVQRQKDNTQPTAMEQAVLENERERERQLETLKKCQKMEERSQKALEREQIRRDCNELTEKLDALTKEYPKQGPNNENELHLFADRQLRKEAKMNSAVEKLLSRPAIITCSEINKPPVRETIPTVTATTHSVSSNDLNLGAVNEHLLPTDDVSSDSCCSILLGYVDDQSNLVKQDLQDPNNIGNTQDITKQKRLKNLLKRLDELRNSLVQELKKESQSKMNQQSQFSSNEENLRQVLDSIGEMRKEREQILGNENAKPVKDREKLLEAKEAILEKRIREFYDLKRQQDKQSIQKDIKTKKSEESSTLSNKTDEEVELSSYDKENIACDTKDKPVEIIITVRGDCKRKAKSKMLIKKSPNKVATLIRSPQPKLDRVKKDTSKKKTQPAALQEKVAFKRQNSYDSNSTSYMSLPSQLPTQIDDLAERILKENEKQKPTLTTSTSSQKNKNQPQPNNGSESEAAQESLQNVRILKQPARVNPLIAQYVQRLLGMSRSAIQKLDISSSDIETPTSSIINSSTNIVHSDSLITSQRLIDVQNFVEENKSFIKDLEKSISTQNSVSLENSMKMFDDLWRKRLKTHTKENGQETAKSKGKIETKKSLKSSELNKDNTTTDKNTEKQIKSKAVTISRKQITVRTETDQLLKALTVDNKEPLKSSGQSKKQAVEKNDKAIETRLSNNNLADSQISRYAKLTENCTHRIAELTELINRVRQEKQRLLEVTLSSASENGRHSTEYLDLPEAKSSTRNDLEDHTRVSSTSSEEITQNKQSYNSTDTAPEIAKLSSADKNKQITASLDSGIAESRPLTALENRNETEPVSQTSSESTTTQNVRKLKPPPTLKRFSPQLPEDDDLPHELSTIFEVETPATSRMNAAVAASQKANEHSNHENAQLHEPIKFPTFEQYIKQLNLDLTLLDPEQSIQLQKEFTSFLECFQKCLSPKGNVKYKEFPSLNGYLEKSTESVVHLSDTMPESTDVPLHLSNISAKKFPSVREYIKRNAPNAAANDEQQQQLLDTESLENVTGEGTNPNTEEETVSIDIEDEMKKRKILKNSFRYVEQKKKIFSSTANRDAEFYNEILATESGLDKLSSTSSSGNTTEKLEMEIQRITQKLPGQKTNRKTQRLQFLSTTTNSTNTSTLVNSVMQAASREESSNDNSGRALNLRDFLTRELLKRANISGSTISSSSDDSLLRNRFLHSIIDSLTPRTPGANSKSGGQTIERQKTSTPVLLQTSQTSNSPRVNNNTNNSPTQLFSGESHLSSVRYHKDRSVQTSANESDNADDHHSS